MNGFWLLTVAMSVAVDAGVDLLKKALGGDRRAMRDLVEWLMPIIRRTVRYALRKRGRFTLGAHDGDDLVQEVWTHILDKDAAVLRKFDPTRGNLEAYVTVVARSKTRGERIKTETQKSGGNVTMTNLDDLHGLSGGADPEAQAMSRELAGRLKAALIDTLPERGKLIFTYIYVDGRKPADVAEVMQVTTQVVYNWQHRIRTIIRNVRANMETGPEPSPAG